MNLKIVKMFDDVITPKKANKTDSGFDVYAYSFKIHYWGDDDTEYKSEYPKQVYPSSITLDKNDRVLIGTGIKLTYGEGYEIQVRPRSGLALNKGLTVLNTPGTIDEPYRNELGIILINLSHTDQVIEIGERIAQIVVCKVELPEIEIVQDLDNNDRGGGFGSSGLK